MNINALLSPESSPSQSVDGTTHPATKSPKKARAVRPSGGKRTTSGLSNEVRRSPDQLSSRPGSRPSSGRDGGGQHAFPLQSVPEATTGFRPLQQAQYQQPPTSNPSPAYNTSQYGYTQTHTSQQRPVMAHRHSSSAHMEALADLASMQQRQTSTRTTSSANLRQADIVEAQRSPTVAHSARPASILRNTSGQSLADLTMAEAPSQTPPPRSFTSNTMSEAEVQTITDLLSYLGDNSYAYASHVQLIDLLHKGFLAHVYPPADAPETFPRDPHSYGLLNELRQAREAMDSRFAVGEDIWIDWLADEVLTATSGEERVTLTELYQKAVQDEPASVKLWMAYADWVESNYATCHDLEGAEQSGWIEEDKEMCKELFTREMLANVLEQAVAATQWRLDESHLLWNRYAKLLQQDLSTNANAAEVARLREIFMQRFQVPHSALDDTRQMFWPFINQYEPSNWEATMAQANEMAEPAKRQVGLREEYELAVRRASDSDDKEALFNAFTSYLQWERKHKDRGTFAYELCCSVHERALLRFPTYTDWWIDYVDLVTSKSPPQASVLPLMERATRHAPWSGDLWGKRIVRSSVEKKPRNEIEHTKHRATNSGLLDVGGLEELLKVLQQWCSYLRRHAFDAASSEDDQDTAEVGIVQALEDIRRAGEAVYGSEFKGDPLYRLETIQIKFLTEARRPVDAREIYRKLVPMQKDSYDFWAKYYQWELILWGYQRLSESRRVETRENGPHLATAVLQEALSQRNLDEPEKVMNLYLNHFQQHESSEKLQAALIDAREFSKRLSVRRAKEAEAAAAAAAAEAEVVQQSTVAPESQVAPATGEKRKADDVISNGHGNKKVKNEDVPASVAGNGEPSASASAQIKRDREHNTITVRNLPTDVTDLDIKKFFRDVGKPVSINILADKDGDAATATVEFESHEDVLTAKTRNGKEVNGREVRIQSGSQNTLYVANYPPDYDETAIRKLFESYGEIISVRFPSLKFNNRRRFCYVQFLQEEMARAVENAMDGKMLDGHHKLVAKISNPDAKKQRSGAQAEGRELFVKNIERNASETEVTDFFAQYGKVVSINMLKLVNGKKTGTAFVVLASADEANAALAANNKPFRDRILHVELATPKAEGRAAPLDRARKEDVIIKGGGGAASASPEPDSGRRGSDVSMASASAPAHDDSFKTARERKVAIFHLPDTVNDARIRTAMEQYGPIVKIQLRRQDGGAIVEFADVNVAFNVRQGVDLGVLGEGVRTGDVGDLLKKKGKVSQSGGGKLMGPPTAVSRPAQRGGGRRGGLGVKRGGAGMGFAAASRAEGAGAGASTEQAGGGKSNADFRAMMEAGKPTAQGSDEAAASGEP